MISARRGADDRTTMATSELTDIVPEQPSIISVWRLVRPRRSVRQGFYPGGGLYLLRHERMGVVVTSDEFSDG